MFFDMNIAPGRGRQPFVGEILRSTEKPCHFALFVTTFKNISLKSDFIHNFLCFYTCI